MTKQPHDQFAKQYLKGLLAPLGTVESSRDVPTEVQQVDVWFEPSPQSTTDPQMLGVLGRLVTVSCLLEAFRNQPSKTEVRNCLLKLLSVQGEFLRQLRRDEESVTENELPRLWILTTSASEALLDSFGAKLELDNWPSGVYFLADALRTAIIAINQLPITEETLWLRLLGKGKTQENAINELIALPQDNPLRRNALEQIAIWRVNIQLNQNSTQDDRELLMTLSPAYLEWREATFQEGKLTGKQEGRQEGRQEGTLEERASFITDLLKVRFGILDDALSGIIPCLLELPREDVVRMILQLSREDLLARFSQ